MKLPYQELHGLEDAQYNFEFLEQNAIFDDGTAFADLGIARGTGTLTFTASTNSTGTTINHGLTGTPTAVLATVLNAPAFGNIPILNVFTVGATSFSVDGQVTSAFTGTVTFSWLAVL